MRQGKRPLKLARAPAAQGGGPIVVVSFPESSERLAEIFDYISLFSKATHRGDKSKMRTKGHAAARPIALIQDSDPLREIVPADDQK
jgi:hypothetical protein